MTTVEQQTGIRPFHVEVPEEALTAVKSAGVVCGGCRVIFGLVRR